jgi:predicted Zn-dependent peptidase
MLKIEFDTFVLKNGLTVILHVDHSSPLVAVDLWYHVGSKDETPGRTGFAHLFEHLMFMGSRNAPYPAFDAIMESWGGHNNGTTSNDRTNYYEIGPRNLLETFLWLEADRLATLPDVITDEELERQRKVVQNERRQSYENRPYARAELEIPSAMYPAAHPYHWPTIGSHEDLEAATVADVQAFFERFYRPSNASLVVAGDFDPAEARALVDRHFGWQPAREAPRRAPAPPVPALTDDVAITLADRVQLPRLRLAWHAPALFAPGDADLDLAAHVLAGGKSSRLYRSLVFERRIAQDVFAYQGSQLYGSLFQVGATAKPGHDLDEIRAAVDAEIARLAADGPTEAELARARNTHLADFYKSLDHLQTRADLLNHYQHVLGDPGGVGRDVARYEGATAASVRDAFARTVAGKRLDLRTLPEAPVAA